MASTTTAPSLSSLMQSTFRKPVFTPQQKSSTPSSGCSNIGLSSGTDTTVSEDDDDTIVRWGWVWYKGEMRKISELSPAELQKPSPPPKRKVRSTHPEGAPKLTTPYSQFDFKPVFSLPSPSPQPRNDTIKVDPIASHCDGPTPDRITQVLHPFHDLEIHSPIPSPVHRKPSFILKPLVEASIDDIFDSDDDLEFEADFADDELEDDEEEDEDYDTLDPNSLARYISAFLDPFIDSDDEYYE